jgi:hypothetical protein
MSELVILAEISSARAEVENIQLLLNLLEMWCAVLFQTLQKPQLEQYLPGTSPPTRTGLNLSLPLAGSLTTKHLPLRGWSDSEESI